MIQLDYWITCANIFIIHCAKHSIISSVGYLLKMFRKLKWQFLLFLHGVENQGCIVCADTGDRHNWIYIFSWLVLSYSVLDSRQSFCLSLLSNRVINVLYYAQWGFVLYSWNELMKNNHVSIAIIPLISHYLKLVYLYPFYRIIFSFKTTI